MSTKSGSSQRFLLSAFRYLGLTSDKGISTDELQRLVTAEGAERRNLWHKIVVKSYPALFNSKLNFETATFDELAEIFSNEVSSQNTIRKCVTFFSYAAKDAGIKISPHVKPYAGTRPSTRQARNDRREGQPQRSRGQPRADSKLRDYSPNLKLLLEKFPDFDPNWSAEAINNWLSGVKGATIIAGDGNVTGGFSTVEETPDEDPDDKRQLTLW
jgi:hypothetical protein